MRIDRVRLKNFCGVSETEVKFAPKGVTVVHGPNESGKSTLMQAIDILFDHRDDSKKEEVRLTKPVDRDVGSEVEADVKVGAFRFTYFKRFHKEKETRLTIYAPKAENLTGREAHDRVRQILDQCLDINLWMALRIVQGRNLEMPELHNQPALAQALDRAAGQAKSGEREEGLFEAAHSEYLQYFTDKGKEKEDPVGRARTHAENTAEAEQGFQRQLKELEDEITHYSRLAKATDTLSRSLGGLESAEKKAQNAWDTVSKLSNEVERCKGIHQLAEQMLVTARGAVQQRQRLIEAAQTSGDRIKESTAKDGDLARALVDAEISLKTASSARDGAVTVAEQAEKEEKLRRSDQEYRHDEFELVRLEERLERIETAEAAATTASEVISATTITEQLRSNIRNAELKLGTDRGILNMASPQLHIKALRPAPIIIDGKAERLDTGEECTTPVAETVTARFGETIEIRVEPGTSAQTLQQKVRDSDQALNRACDLAGVSTPAEAESTWTKLADAKRTIEQRDRIVKENLRDLTHQKLEELVQSIRAKVAAYPEKRSSTLPLPAVLEEAKRFLAAAEKSAAEARDARQRAEVAYTQANEIYARRREARSVNSALLDQAGNDLKLAEDRLRDERKAYSDDALAAALATAEEADKKSLSVLQSAQTSLNNSDPQTAKAILETAKTAHSKAQDQHRNQERELLQLRTKLDLLGERGLAEALAEAARVAYEAQDFLTRLLRRAGAAKLLFETLQAEREVARRTYVAPLREGIERLGRHVFGPTLRVEVDDMLQVVNRTVDGVTVALDQLSTGAREQMGLLVRIATALIVAKDGGVPLVLDDALGSTDQGRLEAMGAVLRIASQDTQTIILTCAPERYVHVGAEATVTM